MKMATTKKLSREAQAALDAVRDLPGDKINLMDPDAPEVRDWSGAVRGALFREAKPYKRLLTLRVDADVLDWFKRQGQGYQTRINEALREHMERQGIHGR
jgi:uncharacterized protein (DUF4415 family)